MHEQFLYQFGDLGSIGNILYFIMIIIFFMFYSRIMVSQMIWKLEQSAELLEGLTRKGKYIVTKKISKAPSKELKQSINNFLEFFIIEPVSLDPYGIIKKLEHVTNLSEKRFKYFISRTAPKMDVESQANVTMGLSAAISLNQIAKIVRHYVEMIRKTKNLQLAMILQMQVPLIERIAKALLNGTEALTNGWPIGDCAGSVVAAKMMDSTRLREIEEDTVLAKRKIHGKQVYVIKAKGPGGRLGKLGKAVEKLIKREKIAKVITVDAAAKLEGEKTGSIAEGIGVAIGGIGVDRSYIENITVAKSIPLDSVVIKMSQEEAIQPMKKEVLQATDKVIKIVEDNIAETKERGSIIVVGVGNTGGVGNDKKSTEKTEKTVKRILQIVKARKEKQKKGFFGFLTGSQPEENN